MSSPKLCSSFCALAVFLLAVGSLTYAQEPPPPPPESTTASQPAAPAKNETKKYSHYNDFLIHGTVFTEKALAFPGVELRIRRAGDKKARWDTYTNSRGEFAVRVPQGSDYELVVHAKGFTDQKRSIDAKNGMNEESLVFRMELLAGEKK